MPTTSVLNTKKGSSDNEAFLSRIYTIEYFNL